MRSKKFPIPKFVIYLDVEMKRKFRKEQQVVILKKLPYAIALQSLEKIFYSVISCEFGDISGISNVISHE
jgi:hypothetical protein